MGCEGEDEHLPHLTYISQSSTIFNRAKILEKNPGDDDEARNKQFVGGKSQSETKHSNFEEVLYLLYLGLHGSH